MTPTPLTESTLLEHAAFVRALAGSLLRDPDRADDVAQETLVRALERPPRELGHVRRWLARVAERLVWRTTRADGRRARRELRAARPEAGHTEADEPDHGRENVLASVTAAVLALREPYRSTVLASYYEGRSARDIALAEGISLHTVHARLRRAREQLRGRLDREVRGGRAAWTAGLSALTGAPLPVVSTPSSPPIHDAAAARLGSVFAVSTNTKLAAVGGILLLLLGAFALVVSPPPPGPRSVDAMTEPGAAALSAQPAANPSTDLTRTRVAESGTATASRGADAKATTGSVLLVATWAADGSPAVDRSFGVCAYDDPNPLRTYRTVRTDAAGEARIDGLNPGTILLYGDVGGGGSVQAAAGEEVTAAIAIPVGIELRGAVVDALGARVAGATVWLTDFGNDEAGNVVATTDARGAFRVLGVGDGRSVGAFAGGYSSRAARPRRGRAGGRRRADAHARSAWGAAHRPGRRRGRRRRRKCGAAGRVPRGRACAGRP